MTMKNKEKIMKEFLIKLVHWFRCYMVDHQYLFTDKISGNLVYRARCVHCNRKGLVESVFPLPLGGVFWDEDIK